MCCNKHSLRLDLLLLSWTCCHHSISITFFYLDMLFSAIYSFYESHNKDRAWGAFCNNDLPPRSLFGYSWTDSLTELYRDFYFTCDNNGVYGVLTGIESHHYNGDRQYRFECAYFQNKTLTGCGSSIYKNKGESWYQVNPTNKYLIGLDSVYDSGIK